MLVVNRSEIGYLVLSDAVTPDEWLEDQFKLYQATKALDEMGHEMKPQNISAFTIEDINRQLSALFEKKSELEQQAEQIRLKEQLAYAEATQTAAADAAKVFRDEYKVLLEDREKAATALDKAVATFKRKEQEMIDARIALRVAEAAHQEATRLLAEIPKRMKHKAESIGVDARAVVTLWRGYTRDVDFEVDQEIRRIIGA